ncbi:hypothetical protein D3C71_1670890 [compost metagenome]
MFFIASDTTCSKGGSHGITDGFLYRGKRLVCRIWSTVSIQFVFKQIVLYNFQVVFRNQTVGIKDHEVISFSPFKAIVPGKTLPCIGFEEVLYIQRVLIFLDNCLCVLGRTIFNHQHFKLRISLTGKRTQQLVNLLRSVIKWYNYRKKHELSDLLFYQISISFGRIAGNQLRHKSGKEKLRAEYNGDQ